MRQGWRQLNAATIGFGLYMPPAAALVTAGLGFLLGASVGDTALLITLGASASYIAVPAAMRLALLKANPSVYLTLSVGMTGYTVMPAMAGYGGGNRWTRESDLSASRDMVVIISVGEKHRVTEAMEQIASLLGDHIGIVTVTDVEVLGPDRF